MKPLLYTYLMTAILIFLLGTPVCRTTSGMTTLECGIVSAGAGAVWPALVGKYLYRIWR